MLCKKVGGGMLRARERCFYISTYLAETLARTTLLSFINSCQISLFVYEITSFSLLDGNPTTSSIAAQSRWRHRKSCLFQQQNHRTCWTEDKQITKCQGHSVHALLHKIKLLMKSDYKRKNLDDILIYKY